MGLIYPISFDKIESKGLLLTPRLSSRYPAKYITDLDFADDIALPSNTVEDAEALLHALEEAAAYVGLHCNATKTEYTSSAANPLICSRFGETIKHVTDFKYLGSYIMNSEKDFKTRKALAWVACNKLDKIWKSNLSKMLKINLFRSTVEPVLMYGSETWTLNSRLHKRLDGCYTNLLKRIQNISWKVHPTLQQIYGNIPKISNQLIERRTRFAGHCFRSEDEIISSVLLWKPSRSRKLNYISMICRDTDIKEEDLATMMANRECCRKVVLGISPKGEG